MAPSDVNTRRRDLTIGAIALAIAATAGMAGYMLREPTSVSSVRFQVTAAQNSALSAATRQTIALVSPDGRRVAFIANQRGGSNVIWVRSLDELDGRPLAGTDGAYYPFWSADSRSIGFFANSKLKTVQVDGGDVQTLCDVVSGAGGTWSSQGIILFSGSITGTLSRIALTGGTPTNATKIDATPVSSAIAFRSFFRMAAIFFLCVAFEHSVDGIARFQ
jgi:hypothetical protein